jgi:hypothetical protein
MPPSLRVSSERAGSRLRAPGSGLVLLVAGVWAVLFCAPGCNPTVCDTDPASNPPADYRGGTKHGEGESAAYETSGPDEAHLNYSAGAQYRIYHQLGGRPMSVELWVSFSATGIDGGNEAPPAGNMTEVNAVNDEYIQVRNNTCADYYLRVVASRPILDGGAPEDASPE